MNFGFSGADAAGSNTRNIVSENRRASESQRILVTDIISEGPIAGLCEGGKSVFVNNDPVHAINLTNFVAPQAQTCTVTSGQNTVTVNLNNTDFAETYNSEFGKRYLTLWGAYGPIFCTSGTEPQPAETFTYSETDYGVVQNGWFLPLTRVSGTALQTSFNRKSSGNWADVKSVQITDTAVRANLTTASGTVIRGVVGDIPSNGANTLTFYSKDSRLMTNLFQASDHDGSSQHRIFLHLYLEIASISGNTITLANNAPTSFSGRFGITAPQRVTSGTSAGTAAAKAHKYPGTQFQFNTGRFDQEPLTSLDGAEGTSSVTLTSISTTALEKDAAAIITGTGTQQSLIDEVKILIAYPQGLYSIDEGNGKRFSAAAAYKVELAVINSETDLETFNIVPGNASFNGVSVFTNEGWNESSTTYQFRISLEDFQPFSSFKIRITRLTNHDFNVENGTTQIGSLQPTGKNDHKIVGTAQIQAVTGLIREKLNFAYTAYANMQFWSKTFNQMPQRTYECFGLKVQVPSNYVTREEGDGINSKYTRNVSTGAVETTPQFWDGNFRDELVYTDNPAWVFYDILTNNRYGLGDYLEAEDIDKYSLYKIARHCDELVPDGKGGQEPRFRANLYLTKGADAYKVMKDFATIFRGMLYWADSKFFAVIDERKEPIFNFSRSNVIDGQFSYQTTGDKTRVNQVVVSWNNPDGDYKLEPLIVEDRENQIRTNRIRTEKAVAFGCTSFGQALRYGRWKLWTSINQTEIVTFTSSIDASFLTPGDIINVHDDVDYEIPFSGRMSSYNAGTPSITLDRSINTHFSGGFTYDIAIILPKRTILLNQDSATIQTSGGAVSKSRGDEITEAKVEGAVKTLVHSTTGTVNGAVNNSKSVTLDSSNSLITIGDTITGAGIDRAITVENISGTSLTLSVAQTIADNATLTFENPNTTQQNILSATDNSNNPLNLQYEESTIVEERTLTTGSTTTSDGKDTIPLSSAFSATPVSGAVWAIKQIPTGGTTPSAASCKEYKILSIAEGNKNEYTITAVEYYEAKFSAVDDEEFLIEVDDPLTPPEKVEEVPMPKNLRILREPKHQQPGEEFTLMWDAPDPLGTTGVSTTYEHLAEFEITHSFGEEVAPSPIIEDAETRSRHFEFVPNGRHTLGVRTISGRGRKSARAVIEIQVDDMFDGEFERVWGGIVRGGFSSQDISVSNSGSDKGTLRFNNDDFVAAPFHDPQLAKRNTTADANSFSLDLTPLANGSYPQQSGPNNEFDWGYAFMDFSKLDASNPNADAIKLVAYKRDTTLDLTYWYDVTKFLADANSIWTSVGNVSVTQGSPKVTASSDIFSNLKVPEAIKIGSAFGAKVAYVESGTVLFLDRSWTAASATGQALSKQELDIDFKDDFIITPVSYHAAGTDDDGNSGSYGRGGTQGNSFLTVLPELDKVGRAIVVDSDVQFLEYNAAEAQQNAADINLTLQAVGFEEAQFQVTGTGFNSVSTAASSFEFADLTVVNNKVTIKVHETDDQASIAYNSAAPLSFTITAREKQFPNNTNRQVTATYNIGKIREGTQGNSTALVYLYKNSTSALTSSDIDSNFPTVTVALSGTGAGTITAISSGSISGAGQIASTGWHKTPQTPGTGEKAYVVAATANGTGTSDTIDFGEWSDPVQFSGADGASGFSSATVEIFKLSTSAGGSTTTPDQALTYKFSDGTLKNSSGVAQNTAGNVAGFNGWRTVAPTPNNTEKYLYKRTAAAIATTLSTPANTTDSIATNDWSDAVLIAQLISGVDGAAGKRNFVGTLFYGVGVVDANQDGTPDSGAPALPSGSITYTFADSSFSGGTMNNWSFTSPTFDPFNNSDQKLLWYACTVTAEENTAGGGTSSGSNLTFTNRHIVHSFSGVVAFTDLSASSGSTVIHGSRITTGTIAGPGYNSSSNGGSGVRLVLDTTSLGTNDKVFDLTTGTTSKFSITKGGSLNLAGGIFTGANTLDGTGATLVVGSSSGGESVTIDGQNQRITINDGSDDRVKLGKLT